MESGTLPRGALKNGNFKFSHSVIYNFSFTIFLDVMFDMFKSLLGGGGVATISAQELKQLLTTNDKPILLDVRQPQEHKAKNIPGSVLIPLGELPSRMKELERYKNREIVVYCASGGRSSSACGILSQAGYSVKNLSGGMMRW